MSQAPKSLTSRHRHQEPTRTRKTRAVRRDESEKRWGAKTRLEELSFELGPGNEENGNPASHPRDRCGRKEQRSPERRTGRAVSWENSLEAAERMATTRRQGGRDAGFPWNVCRV